MLPEWSAELTTRTGLKLNVRPASLQDQADVGEFYRRVTPDDLRYRFLSSIKSIGPGLVQQLVDVDHTETESLLAFDSSDGRLAATAMISVDDPGGGAEVAVSVRSDLKGRGVGWTMLQHACDYAKARGIKELHTLVFSDNRSTIALEEEMGFTGSACPDDTNLTILTKRIDRA
jgi:acetyltransferase